MDRSRDICLHCGRWRQSHHARRNVNGYRVTWYGYRYPLIECPGFEENMGHMSSSKPNTDQEMGDNGEQIGRAHV